MASPESDTKASFCKSYLIKVFSWEVRILKWDHKAKEAKQRYEPCQSEGNSIPKEFCYKTHLRIMYHLGYLRAGGQER